MHAPKLLFLSLLPAVVQAQGFTWTTNADGTLNIAGYTDTNTVVTIPSVTNHLTVTSIGDSAFSPFLGNTGPSSVTIPDTVTSIGAAAFEEDFSLTSVTIPDSVTNIGAAAFQLCESLTTSITIPNGVTSIEPLLFYGCSRLTSVTLGTNASRAFCRNVGRSAGRQDRGWNRSRTRRQGIRIAVTDPSIKNSPCTGSPSDAATRREAGSLR